MLRNYLLLAFKVLARRKFYTFISLFGIALTLMVLTVVTALIENVVHPNGPEGESGSYLIVSRLSFRRTVDGEVTGRWSSSLGYRFVEDRVMGMETPALVAVHTETESVVGFREGGKITSSLRRANAVIVSAGILLGSCVLFSLYPSFQATRRDPVEALRYE